METAGIYQISLIAAYIAGMVALFAPCCISYLFPAYLGNVFRERKDVLFMTFIYSLGIFTVMMPIVLGAKALQSVFFNLHDQTYLFGGIFMLIVAVMSFIGLKLPMPHLALKQDGKPKNDVVSTFTLGIFSGITSACCAPVLVGVIALSSLSPTILQSLGVGAFYVLGMVTPLYLASLLIHKKNILKNPILKKVITTIKIGKTTYPIFVSNIIAAFIFGITGALMLYLTSIGKLGMTVAESQVTKQINDVAFRVTEMVSAVPGLDILFAIIGVYLLYKFAKSALSMGEDKNPNPDAKYVCPMHPDVTSDKPGKCHKCGGMDLVKMGEEDSHGHHDHDHSSMMATPEAARDFLNRFFIVTFLLVPLFIFSHLGVNILGYDDFVARPYILLGIATVIFYFGLVFFEHAKHEIASKSYGMMTLVSIAVGAGYLFSVASTFLPQLDAEFYLEIATLIWVLLFGHFLEAKSSTAAGDALSEVAKLLPKDALRLRSGKVRVEERVSIEELENGDVVRVLAGEKVPADGEIIKGSSSFNEAHISGESRPLHKKEGDMVVAGAICINGSVEVKLNKVGESSTIGQIKKLISEASKTKPSAQKLADKAAKWLTFSALGVAVVTILVWLFIINSSLAFATTLAITVLVIACPHALGLAIPTVTTIATRIAVKNGLFIKDMGKLEIAKNVDYIVFDKTGTLTKGEFGVTKIINRSKLSDKKLLQIAASIESHSSHVIGQSIFKHAKRKKIKIKGVSKVRNIAGKGIEGKIGSKKYFIGKHKDISVAVLENKKLIGEIILSDEIKPESKKAIKNLHSMNIKVAMLTGDSEKVAKEVAGKLNIDTYFAGVLPEDKYKIIKFLQNPSLHTDAIGSYLPVSGSQTKEMLKQVQHDKSDSDSIVLMVGDGVNDAPALTQADVGIAVGAGTDVAVEAGDVVLTSSNPESVVSFVKLSKKVYNKMLQNLFWALGYNVLAIPAAAGLFIPVGFRLTPAVGALLMSLSSVIVVINAFSLKSAKID